MNCQSPKISSTFKNFPGESREGFVVCIGPTGNLVKKQMNFGGLASYTPAKPIANIDI